MTILSSPLIQQMGIEVHLTNAKSLRSRVKRNLQARFCRGVWGGDSPFDLSATVSDGTKYEMPAATRRAKTKLRLIQWRNRNKVLGNKKLKIKASNRALRYYVELQGRQARIANIRQDTIQKMTTDLSRRIYNIRIEDLNVSGMMANHKLANAVSDKCFYEIRRQLIYKQAHYGTSF